MKKNYGKIGFLLLLGCLCFTSACSSKKEYAETTTESEQEETSGKMETVEEESTTKEEVPLEEKSLEAQFESDPEKVYSDYVQEVLIPKYGNAQMSGEYFYEKIEGGPSPGMRPFAPGRSKPIRTGILTTYVGDLEKDGEKELAVFRLDRASQETEEETGVNTLLLDVYAVMNGEVQPVYSNVLERIFFGTEIPVDEFSFQVSVKEFEAGNAFVLHSVSSHFTCADVVTNSIVLLRFDKQVSGQRIGHMDTYMDGSGEDDIDTTQLLASLRQCGFTSVNEQNVFGYWGKLPDWLNGLEPDCRTLIRGASGMTVAEGGYNENLSIEYHYLEDMTRYGNYTDHPIRWQIAIEPKGNVPSAEMGTSMAKITEADEPKTEAQKAHAAYRKFLEEKENTKEKGYYTEQTFALLDINQDGIDELIYGEPIYPAASVYTSENGFVKELWPFIRFDDIWYDPINRALVIQLFNHGFYLVEVFYHNGQEWDVDGASVNDERWSWFQDKGTVLSFEDFCLMAEEEVAYNSRQWSEADLTEEKLMQYYQEYLQEKREMEEYQAKYFGEGHETGIKQFENISSNRDALLN